VTHRYLDLDGGWPGDVATGVVVDADGILRLAPLAGDPVALASAAAGALAGAAGIGVAPDGTVYVADPAGSAITVVHCDGSVAPFACLRGPGPSVGQIDAPEGVLVGPRAALYVADTGNGRVQVVDLPTGVVTGVWTGFSAPVDLAADTEGRIYVADRAAPRIARFDAGGREDAAFWAAVQASGRAPAGPRAIATLERGGEERLLVIDQPVGQPASMTAFGLDGALDAELTAAFSELVADDVAAAAVAGDVLYLAGAGGVLAFGFDGSFLGRLPDTHGRASGLGLDCAGRLVVAGAGGIARLEPTRRVLGGRLLVGPVPLVDGIARWDRVAVELAAPLPDGTHLRIWTLVTAAGATPAPPPATPAPGEERARTAPGHWRAGPRDAHDALVLHEEAPDLWICLDLAGDGLVTPEVSALRVDGFGLGLLERLPAIYAAGDDEETAWRLLALLAAPLDELSAAIADLPRLFDAQAVPDREGAAWLNALAAWVAMPLEREWSEEDRRRLVAEAFVRHGQRGTRAALEETLGHVAQAPVRIAEPAAQASLWQLDGEGSVLGFTTMLAPAEAQGAVVGTTAEVDRSHLIPDADFGWPLFADVAHRFCVHVQAVAIDAVRLGALQAAIETEKPAHTLGHLCVVEPRTSVGFQAHVGVDMVVGAPPPTLRLGDELDVRHVLGETDRPTVGGRIGQTTQVGRAPAHELVGG
jgi:phage tail-like protein